jgi:hypothetical protein
MQVKNIVLLVVFILLIVVIQWARGQNVDDIIKKYIDARGGKEKLNAIHSVYMVGIRHMMGKQLAIKVSILPGKLFRTDFEYDGKPGLLTVTPREGWSHVPIGAETVTPIPADTLKTLQAHMDIAGPLLDYSSKGYTAELEEKEMINGKEAHKINLISADGNTATYYIDVATDLLVQIKQTTTDANGHEKEVITNLSDYGSVDGVMFPYTITNPDGGIMGGVTKFEIIMMNKTIDESNPPVPGNV